jgi:hypothetical protein
VATRLSSDLSVPIILFISRYINRLTVTDGFRVLSHQFAPSSLLRLANCISRSKTCSLTTKHLTPALLRWVANGDQDQNTPTTLFPVLAPWNIRSEKRDCEQRSPMEKGWNACQAEQRIPLGGRRLWCNARVELASCSIRSRARSRGDCMRSREVESPRGGIEHIPAHTLHQIREPYRRVPNSQKWHTFLTTCPRIAEQFTLNSWQRSGFNGARVPGKAPRGRVQ